MAAISIDPSDRAVSMRRLNRLATTLVRGGLGAVLGVALGCAHAGKAHEHGVGRLDLAQDGLTVTLELELPLEVLVGFERAPRSAAERQAAQAAVARLRDVQAVVRPITQGAGSACEPLESVVEAPVLEGTAAPVGGHADARASYTFRCADALGLRALELPIFESHPRLQRLRVQAVGPQGQRRWVLGRADRRLDFSRSAPPR